MLGLARRLLGLAPRRHRAAFSTTWVPLSDGVRLATSVVRPLGAGETVPAVLIRTDRAAHAPAQRISIFCRLLAESGYVVVVQECRGRHASEGEFVPFENEAADGVEAIDWMAEQPWFDGRLALVGVRYGAFAAFAAASRAADRVGALVAAFGARDPHAALYTGGALELASALHFAASHSEREEVAEGRIDLARGARFQPPLGADRVALRQVDWYREWLEHPRPDAYWEKRTPPLPAPAPPTLLLAGWYDAGLGAQLADYAALEACGARPELVVGPWQAGRPRRAARAPWGEGALPAILRETLAFVDRRLGGVRASRPPLRIFVAGERRWREAAAWPLPEAEERRLHLRSRGRANSLVGDGRLEPEPPPAEEPPDGFAYDPADPVPSCGGALPGRAGGPADQRAVEARADVLCYTTQPLPGAVSVAGPVRVVLHAASSAPDTDFTAKLVDVDADGVATNLCEGIARCRWRGGGEEPAWLEAGEPTRIEIELWGTACRFAAGHRIRVEIASSNLPRFDRNGNVRAEPARVDAAAAAPARQTVFHDAARPSHLVLPVLP